MIKIGDFEITGVEEVMPVKQRPRSLTSGPGAQPTSACKLSKE